MSRSYYPAPFTSAHTRANIVKVLLIIGAGTSGISLLIDALSFALPAVAEEQELSDNPVGAVVMLFSFLLAILDGLIYLVTAVFFLLWLYRAYSNLRAFNPSRPLDHSAGWAVASFFIPIANLFVPYRAVKEVWQKSGPPGEAFLYEPSPPATFPAWWTFWLLASFANNISMRVSFDEDVPLSTVTIVSVIASALSVLSAVFAYVVVNAIDKRQEETIGRLQLQPFPGPPPPQTSYYT